MVLIAKITVTDGTLWGKVNNVLTHAVGGSVQSLTLKQRFAIYFKGVIKTWPYFYRYENFFLSKQRSAT